MAGTDGQARDDTFPTSLYCDYIAMDGSTFVVDVPEKAGKYHGWVVYDDLGYWDGEEAQYHKRSILANNAIVFSEDQWRCRAVGLFLPFREKIEPHPGDSLWGALLHEASLPAAPV